MILLFGIYPRTHSSAAELVVLILFALMSVVVSEIAAVASAERLRIREALFFTFLILVLWCLQPILILANHAAFRGIIPLTLGPLFALSILLA